MRRAVAAALRPEPPGTAEASSYNSKRASLPNRISYARVLRSPRMTSPDDYAALHESAAIGAIAPRRQVAVAGPDRAAFLQGLLTNDMASLTAGTGCYAAWLTPQGRMLCDVHVLRIRRHDASRRPRCRRAADRAASGAVSFHGEREIATARPPCAPSGSMDPGTGDSG